jgi:hypothetical protein
MDIIIFIFGVQCVPKIYINISKLQIENQFEDFY